MRKKGASLKNYHSDGLAKQMLGQPKKEKWKRIYLSFF